MVVRMKNTRKMISAFLDSGCCCRRWEARDLAMGEPHRVPADRGVQGTTWEQPRRIRHFLPSLKHRGTVSTESTGQYRAPPPPVRVVGVAAVLGSDVRSITGRRAG